MPRKINPRISEGLESVIWKALRKNRADCYQTVGELEHDLERLTAGISPQTRQSRRVRHRVLLWAAAALIVMVVAAAYFLRSIRRGLKSA
jgi:type VI protein secretion system component VasF